MKSQQNHLPLFGPGPFFGVIVIALTVLLKQTEEKWLSDLYGEEYKDYCRRVNRCIPWFKNQQD